MSSKEWRLTTGLVVVQSLVIWLRIQDTWFTGDDFMNMEIYKTEGLTMGYLLHPVFGQLVPGFRLLYAAYSELFGLNIAAYVVYVMLVSAATVAGLVAVSSRLKLSEVVTACGGLIYTCLLQHTHSYRWMAAAFHTLLPLCLTVWALYLLLGESPRRGIWVALMYAVGMLFTPKMVFSIVFLASVLTYAELRQGCRVLGAAKRALRPMVWLIPVVAGYGLLMTMMYMKPHLANGLGVKVRFVWQSILDGTMAGTLGLGAVGPHRFRESSVMFVGIGVVALVIASIWADGRKGILWAGLMVYLVSAMGSVARYRAGWDDPMAATWGRYNVENATFFLLVMMVVMSDLSLGKVARVVMVLGTLLVVLNLNAQSDHANYWWMRPDTARSYVRLVQAHGMADDDIVPSWVMAPHLAPYNRGEYFSRICDGK